MFGLTAVISISYLVIICVTIDNVEGGCENYQQLRDNATLDYLKLERDLWINITSSPNDDNERLFEMVRSEHKKFLINFGELSYSDVLYELPSTKLLEELIGKVRHSRISLNDLVTSDSLRFVSDSDKNLSSLIARELTRPEFWNDGINYLDLCKNYEYDASKVVPHSTVIEAPYQKIYEYYHQSTNALLQTYISTQISLMMKSIQDKDRGKKIYQSTESLLAFDQFKERIKSIHQLATNALKSASREVWNCRRNKYASGCVECSRFEAITNFLTGYIDNEINLNKDGTCSASCSDYTLTKHYNCANGTMCAEPNPERDPNGLHKEDTICDGLIRDCRDIGIDGDILVNFVKYYSAGRYNYIEFNNGSGNQTYGLSPKDVYGRNLTAPTWNAADGSKCSNCFCLCDTQTESSRRFSLHEVVSNIQENKVVNGIRLFNQNGFLQLKIFEGKLRKRAQSDYGGSVSSKYQFERYQRPIEGIDYFSMNYENHSINLDDVVLPAGKVVTGVRFAHRDGHVLLEIRGTDLDYEGGRLKNIDESVWYSNEEGGKHEIELPNRLNPFEKHNIGKLYVPQSFRKNSYVRFVPSDFQTDLSQMMLPVIETDWHGTVSNCQTALSGIGLTYVNDEGQTTAGAIIPKIFVYEFPIPPLGDLLL